MRIEILRRIFRENENKKNELPQDRLSWQQQRSPQPGQSLNYTTITSAGLGWAGLGWAGLGWAWLGWQGLGPLGDSETVRCQMLAVADTGHWTWTVGQKYD